MKTPFRIEITGKVNPSTKAVEFSVYNAATDDHSPFMTRPAAKMFLEGMVNGLLEKASIQVIKENPNAVC